MNFNAIIAVLVLKNVLTEDEAERLVEHLNDKPQSTVLRDAIAAVAEVIGKPAAPIMSQLGPVGPAQHAEEMAARANPPVATAPVAPPIPPHEPENTLGPTAEPELGANEAKVDEDQAATDETAAHREADKPGGSTYTPESEKDTKTSSVKKSTDTAAKK